MFSGAKLGAAIALAIKAKGVTQAQLARDFGVKPPSVQDWIKYGRIDKSKLEDLFLYFSCSVTPQHWGMTKYPAVFNRMNSTPSAEQVDRICHSYRFDFALLPEEEQRRITSQARVWWRAIAEEVNGRPAYPVATESTENSGVDA